MNEFLIFQGMTPEMVLWPMYIGVCVAILYSHFLKIKLGPFVKALIKAKAISPESALSLEELGFEKNKHVLYDLKRKSGLRRLVERCEVKKTPENKQPDDVEKSALEEKCVKYYIPDEKVGRADAIYVNGGSSLKMTIIMLVVFLALTVLLLKLAPLLINLINNFDAFL